MLHQKKYGTLLCSVLFYFSKSIGGLKGAPLRGAVPLRGDTRPRRVVLALRVCGEQSESRHCLRMQKHKAFLTENVENCSFAPITNNFAKASSLGALGKELLEKGIHDNLNECKPMYLRKSQAEREYDKKVELSNNEG